jgi:hypothetical protein
LPARELVSELPGIELAPDEVALVGHGRISRARSRPRERRRCSTEADLVAVAQAVPAGIPR